MSSELDVLNVIKRTIVTYGIDPNVSFAIANRILTDLHNNDFEIMERKVEVGAGEYPRTTYVRCTKCSDGFKQT
jgi:hypothetical protein